MGTTITHTHSGTGKNFTLRSKTTLGTCGVDTGATATFIRAVRIA